MWGRMRHLALHTCVEAQSRYRVHDCPLKFESAFLLAKLAVALERHFRCETEVAGRGPTSGAGSPRVRRALLLWGSGGWLLTFGPVVMERVSELSPFRAQFLRQPAVALPRVAVRNWGLTRGPY